MKNKIFVFGSDLRLFYAARALEEEGFEVCLQGIGSAPMTKKEILSLARDCDILLLGINAGKDFDKVSFAELADAVGQDKIVIGGGDTGSVFKSRYIDYLKRDDFAYYNAVPTAEGVIDIAMRETDITVSGAKCLVIGYGRIGKIIANMFSRLGTRVTASARKAADIAQITAMGYNAARTDYLSQFIGEFDIIVNTVPHRIIDKEILEKISDRALVIDTASKPGGVDMDEAERLGVKVIHALALPGKVAPKSAGEIICTTVQNILEELRE